MIIKKYYTAGELAKMAGISYKSIRVYTEKGLLIPDKVNDNGYKLFSETGVERLQKIILLRYLDFSLEEISGLLDDDDIEEPFIRQSELIEAKITHLYQVKSAIDEMKFLSDENRLTKMLEIMRLMSHKEDIINQYKKTDNLDRRINIHKYSTSKTDWFDFILSKSELTEGMNILDVGCGNGTLWYRCRELLPADINIYLVDNSEAMIAVAAKLISAESTFYNSKNINFHYFVCDAAQLRSNREIEAIKYQRIFANHMLYHLDDNTRKTLYESSVAMLADGGKFIASTIGSGHMKEIFELAKLYDSTIEEPEWMCEGFNLDNGSEQLQKYFSEVNTYIHDNNLSVPEWRAVYDYLCTLPGNIRVRLEKNKKDSEAFFKNRISEEKPFFISKCTGLFTAEK